MFKRLCQFLALAILSALLVYAPEIFTAVSAPYRVSTPSRVLLRVVLCCEDGDTVSSLYSALEDFRGTQSALHLRVVRADEAQLSSLAEPPPDVYLFGEEAFADPQSLFLPLEVLEADAPDGAGVLGGVRYAVRYVPQKGTPLLCAVGAQTREADAARALAAYLRAPEGEAAR